MFPYFDSITQAHTSSLRRLQDIKIEFLGTIRFLEKLIMQFMSHSPVRCPSATSLRLIRS